MPLRPSQNKFVQLKKLGNCLLPFVWVGQDSEIELK
jgi:hypothetical protein